jgi:hypothetical protein
LKTAGRAEKQVPPLALKSSGRMTRTKGRVGALDFSVHVWQLGL